MPFSVVVIFNKRNFRYKLSNFHHSNSGYVIKRAPKFVFRDRNIRSNRTKRRRCETRWLVTPKKSTFPTLPLKRSGAIIMRTERQWTHQRSLKLRPIRRRTKWLRVVTESTRRPMSKAPACGTMSNAKSGNGTSTKTRQTSRDGRDPGQNTRSERDTFGFSFGQFDLIVGISLILRLRTKNRWTKRTLVARLAKLSMKF